LIRSFLRTGVQEVINSKEIRAVKNVLFITYITLYIG